MAQVHVGEKLNGDFLSPYCVAVPEADQKDLFRYDKDGDYWVIDTASGVEFTMAEHAVKVIDIKESGETSIELFVDRGKTAQLMIQDAQGNSLEGAWVAGIAEYHPIIGKLPDATTTIFALNPEKPRTLAIYHPDKNLGGTAVVRGDEKEPVVAKLDRMGEVTGRFLDADGNALAGALVSIRPQNSATGELYRQTNPAGKPVLIDKDGRFVLKGVIPGISFSLQTQRGTEWFRGNPRIGWRQLKSGETLQLGDRTMEVNR